MEFSVMTYNIHLGLDSDLETLAGIIGEADVVALQEVGNDWFEGAQGHQAQQLAKLSGLNHYRFAAARTVTPGSDPPETRSAPTAEIDRAGESRCCRASRWDLGRVTACRSERIFSDVSSREPWSLLRGPSRSWSHTSLRATPIAWHKAVPSFATLKPRHLL